MFTVSARTRLLLPLVTQHTANITGYIIIQTVVGIQKVTWTSTCLMRYFNPLRDPKGQTTLQYASSTDYVHPAAKDSHLSVKERIPPDHQNQRY